jgi:hypothetical protein
VAEREVKAKGDNYSRSACKKPLPFFLGRQYNKKQACHPRCMQGEISEPCVFSDLDVLGANRRLM